MRQDFLKPPSFAMWMLGIVSGGAFLGGVFGGPVDTVASWLVVAGVALAAWVISGWVGRCLGHSLGTAAASFMQGYRESRDRTLAQAAAKRNRS